MYSAQVMHHRLSPKVNRFNYEVFMFYLDLDELGIISKKFRWFGYNRFNIFSFRDRDHIQLPKEQPDKDKSNREHITKYLEENGVSIGKGRIMLLTNLCTMGYVFNPVSFYFCFDEQENPVCSVVEVCNTFREIKPYFMATDMLSKDLFHLYTPKKFYVSPFSDLMDHFDFRVKIPKEKLNIHIDDYDESENLFFVSRLSGHRIELSDRNMLAYFFKIPLITMKIMFLIHWQALKLWAKKLGYHKKAEHPELQTEVFRPYKS